jgi:hypothetical protein
VGTSLRLFLTLVLAVSLASLPASGGARGYEIAAADSSRPAREPAARRMTRERLTALPVGAEIGGFLSPRGLPPRPGRFVVTDTGLVFLSTDGRLAQTYPLIGPIRLRDGRPWRAPTVSLAYADSASGGPVYVFRMDGGVFGTDAPGPLLDVAAGPRWLDSIASREWRPDRPLVSAGDTAGMWMVARSVERSAFADTLYALFGRPSRSVGLVGARGRKAGRLGEYIASRDSLALDPARITSQEQLRHAMTHELAHRWQARSPAQLRTLWQGVAPIRDTRRYGHNKASEHQAEAIAFAVHFLQATAGGVGPDDASLLRQYDLLVPGAAVLTRYLALQPIYARHPLRRTLTTGTPD